MKLFFYDNKKDIRCVESEWELSVLDDQAALKALIKSGSNITPCSAVLAVVK